MRVAFNPFSMENISGLEPPILYVFSSLPKSPNTNHTCRGKRPGKKYAEKKNHWKNKKEQHSEPSQSGSLGGACTKPRIIHSSPKSSRSLHPAQPPLGAAGGSGPAPQGPVGPAEWPRSMPRAGRLAAEPGGTRASIQPLSPSYPGGKDIITRLMNHSPSGPARKEHGRGLYLLL